MKIKLNAQQVIITKDIRNLELQTTTKTVRIKDGEEVESTSKNKAYFSDLGQAILAAARELPILSDAKTGKELKRDYDNFYSNVKALLDDLELPKAKDLIKMPEDLEKGTDSPLDANADELAQETEGFDALGNELNNDDWEDDGEDWDDESEGLNNDDWEDDGEDWD